MKSRSPGTRIPGDPSGREWLTVSSPLLPDLAAFQAGIAEVFASRWLTNQGPRARALEAALAARLGVPRALLFTNGTLAIEVMLRAAVDGGEVIVPAYSFPATWNLLCDDPRYTPVFVDVGPDFQLNPTAVAAAITPRTTAIVGVHAYGLPADHAALSALASRHGLRLLYDAAHAFGVTVGGVPLTTWGWASALSFHATKVFNTLEGGAIVSPDAAALDACASRRSFGFVRGEEQENFGTNGKMDELRALFGLLNLDAVDAAITTRAGIAAAYDARLSALAIDDLVLPGPLFAQPGLAPNFSYYPLRVQARPGGPGRDGVEAALKAVGILPRRYFASTAIRSAIYQGHLRLDALPWTARFGDEILCLPIHHRMTDGDVDAVVHAIAGAFGARAEIA